MTLRVTPAEIVQRAESSGNPGLLSIAPAWSRIALGDVARVINGAPYESRLFNADGRGEPLIRIRDVTSGVVGTWYDGPWEPTHRVEPGAILVGMDGDFRVTRWEAQPGLLNQRVCRIDVDTTKYDERFLVLAIQGYLDAIWKATSSTTVKHLSSKSIQQIPLPLPSREEQGRIVEMLEDHLSRLDEAVRLTSTSLRRTVLLDESAIVRELGVGEHVAGIISGNLPNLEPGWRWLTLGEVGDVVGGVTKDAKKQSDPSYVEVPYLRVANVQRARLDLENVTTIRVSPAKVESLRLMPGDVLMNEGGDRDKLARGWVWEGQIKDCIHQNHVFRARPVTRLVQSEWLAWCANTYGARWAQRHGRQSVNLASISLSAIKSMPIPVAPVEIQERRITSIRDRIESTARLRSEVEQTQQRAVSLRRSLLTTAFSGQLTGAASDTERIEELAEAGV